MNIEAQNFTITIEKGQLWTLGFAVRNYFLHQMKSHYINYPDNWKDNEKPHLELIRGIFYALGRPDVYEDTLLQADIIISEHKKKSTI